MLLGLPRFITACRVCRLWFFMLMSLEAFCSFWLWASITKNVHYGNLVWPRLGICFHREVSHLLQQVPLRYYQIGTLLMLFNWHGVPRIYRCVSFNPKAVWSTACGYEAQGDFFPSRAPRCTGSRDVSTCSSVQSALALEISFTDLSCAFKTVFVIFVRHI